LKRIKTTFTTQTETWYDLEYDSELIAQSIAKQYHILPGEQPELHYSDWILLVGALMEDTPLGQIVLIRKEKDRSRLKHFNSYEHRIRNEWRNFRANQKKNSIDSKEYIADFERMFANMFG
jgi:hypothetical protein